MQVTRDWGYTVSTICADDVILDCVYVCCVCLSCLDLSVVGGWVGVSFHVARSVRGGGVRRRLVACLRSLASARPLLHIFAKEFFLLALPVKF
jgi:hypothetical protein